MQLFCPKCQAAYSGLQRCPRCGGLLLLPHEGAASITSRPDELPTAPAEPTPLGRFAVGVMFSLGLYIGLRRLASGCLLAIDIKPETWWPTSAGFAVETAVQTIAVIFGAVLAATGRVGGFAFGAAVGAVCGGGFLTVELVGGGVPQNVILYVRLVALIALGCVAGTVAARIWKPVPTIKMQTAQHQKLSTSKLDEEEEAKPPRPTVWIRVLVGAAIITAVVVGAEPTRVAVQKNSAGLLKAESVSQGKFITVLFAVIGMLVGGVVAAANTGAGIRHGFLAGGLGGVGVMGAIGASGKSLGPVDYWLSKLSLEGVAPTDPAAILATVGGVLLFGVIGGWLGGTLLQPLAPHRVRLGDN